MGKTGFWVPRQIQYLFFFRYMEEYTNQRNLLQHMIAVNLTMIKIQRNLAVSECKRVELASGVIKHGWKIP